MNWLRGGVWLASWLCVITLRAAEHDITTVDGMVYGPGPMVATPFHGGKFTHVQLNEQLFGNISFFNNGIAEPNIPGELEIFGSFRGGLLSNGLPFNEHLHGGIIIIGQGALRMLAVVASGGASKGGESYHLDEQLNWRWQTDMALDPGFPEGLVISRNLHISTGVLWVPASLQTIAGHPGGFDYADSLPTGAPVYGRIGDNDEDGFLDATMVGVSRVPLNFLFVPGAPIVMLRSIVTDIPISVRASSILELASIYNLNDILHPPQAIVPQSAVDKYYISKLPEWAEDFAARAQHAATTLTKAAAPEAKLAITIRDGLVSALVVKTDRVQYEKQVSKVLEVLKQALPELNRLWLTSM
ncbi:hypothetical protein TI04_00560 [Achromatium sp. WMS2]|nr:hypothetical protein TI04_00560 [Achromatium sp. WMS2]